MSIVVKNVSKRFCSFQALDNLSLEIQKGELLALLGPSGSGKTTLLRIIAGLEFPDEGAVYIDGEHAHLKKIQERNVGFVFQHYALFKHMTVFDNIAFGLRMKSKRRRLCPAQIRHRVEELLSLFHLEHFEERYPSQLSGGQKQRVALARALAVEPKVLLLDEPFGALDAKVRRELRRWIRRMHDELAMTNIFVTHDQEEALEVSDRVAILNRGKIEQVGTPEQIYRSPNSSFVYDFLGNYNELSGWKDTEGAIHLSESGHAPPGYRGVKVFARPHEMVVVKIPEDNSYLSAVVTHINCSGPLVKLELKRGDTLWQADITEKTLKDLEIRKADTVYIKAKNGQLF